MRVVKIILSTTMEDIMMNAGGGGPVGDECPTFPHEPTDMDEGRSSLSLFSNRLKYFICLPKHMPTQSQNDLFCEPDTPMFRRFGFFHRFFQTIYPIQHKRS